MKKDLKLYSSTLVFIALVLISVGCIGNLYLLAELRAHPEYSTEALIVPAQAEKMYEIDTREGRYEYRILSDNPFDFTMVSSTEIERYKAGENISRLDYAENGIYHEGFLQTGADPNSSMIFVNHGESAASVQIQFTFFPFPLAGRLGYC